MENFEWSNDDKVVMTARAMLRSLNYADAARMLFIVMYGNKELDEIGEKVEGWPQ